MTKWTFIGGWHNLPNGEQIPLATDTLGCVHDFERRPDLEPEIDPPVEVCARCGGAKPLREP